MEFLTIVAIIAIVVVAAIAAIAAIAKVTAFYKCTCQAKVDTEKQFRGSPVQTCTERGFYSPKRRQVDHD